MKTGTHKPRGSWWTSAEACKILGIEPRALRKRAEAGTVERMKVGRVSFYRTAQEKKHDEEGGIFRDGVEAGWVNFAQVIILRKLDLLLDATTNKGTDFLPKAVLEILAVMDRHIQPAGTETLR